MGVARLRGMFTTIESIAAQFGCTVAQLRRQYAKNAAQLFRMAEKAEKSGRKLNGYTAKQLRIRAEQALASSKE